MAKKFKIPSPKTLKVSTPKVPKTPKVLKNPRYSGGELSFNFQLFIPVAPRPKERARTYMNKYTGRMATYTPQATRDYEDDISVHAKRNMLRNGLKPFHHPVCMEIMFVISGDPTTYPTGHRDGDLDNLEKAVLDGLNEVVWVDDKLVVQKTSLKVMGATPGVFVRIWAAPNVTDIDLTKFTGG